MAAFTTPSPADLEAFVARYALPAPREVVAIERGTVNSSFQLTFDRGPLFLRLYEAQGLDAARGEAARSAALVAAGVPTVAPLVDVEGLSVTLLAGRPSALFPWCSGAMRCQASVGLGEVEAVGRALAQLHLAPVVAPKHARFEAPALIDLCARIEGGGLIELRPIAASLRAGVVDAEARRDRSVPAGLIHGDLFRDNVLFRHGGTEIEALIDFESASHGPYVYDVAVAMLAWCVGDDLDLELARALAASYASVRPVEPSEQRALYAEALFAATRFAITRIADDTARIGKKWERFAMRRERLVDLGPERFHRAVWS